MPGETARGKDRASFTGGLIALDKELRRASFSHPAFYCIIHTD